MTTEHEPTPAAAHPAGAAGLFIAFEGGDGAGKSTQAELLRDWLESLGRTVLLTHEPGGSPVGRAIRQVLLHGDHVDARAEALLFAADRGHHVQTVIRPALQSGEVVITDRYMDSSIAYQGAGRDLDAVDVQHLSMWATRGLLPALTVVLDVSPVTGRRRRGGVQDRLEAEPDAFHAAVRQRFLDLAAAEPGRYLVIDAAWPTERIQREIRGRVEAALGRVGAASTGRRANGVGAP